MPKQPSYDPLDAELLVQYSRQSVKNFSMIWPFIQSVASVDEILRLLTPPPPPPVAPMAASVAGLTPSVRAPGQGLDDVIYMANAKALGKTANIGGRGYFGKQAAIGTLAYGTDMNTMIHLQKATEDVFSKQKEQGQQRVQQIRQQLQQVRQQIQQQPALDAGAISQLRQQEQQLERQRLLELEQLQRLEQLSQQGQFSTSAVARSLKPSQPLPLQQQQQRELMLQQQLLQQQQQHQQLVRQQQQRDVLSIQRQFNPTNQLAVLINHIPQKAIRDRLLSLANAWLEQARGDWAMLRAEVATTVAKAPIVEPFCVKQNTAIITPSAQTRVAPSAQKASEIKHLQAEIKAIDDYLDRLQEGKTIVLWFYLFGKQFLSRAAMLKEMQNGAILFANYRSFELYLSLSLSFSHTHTFKLTLSHTYIHAEIEDKWFGTTLAERKQGMTMIMQQQSARTKLKQMLEQSAQRGVAEDTMRIYEANLADLNAQISRSDQYLKGLDRYVLVVISICLYTLHIHIYLYVLQL